jgi:hypothetical protein
MKINEDWLDSIDELSIEDAIEYLESLKEKYGGDLFLSSTWGWDGIEEAFVSDGLEDDKK